MLDRSSHLSSLLAVLLLFAWHGQLFACSDYVHLWRPVSELRSTTLAPEGIALFISDCIARLTNDEKRWLVSINPESEISEEFAREIRRSIDFLDPAKFAWGEGASPFSLNGSGSATIWLDFVKPERMVYLWHDQNKPPFAMYRSGEIDTARVRVLIVSSTGKVLLIDELPYMFLLESDFMLPNWVSSGGVWFRRVSFKTAQMTHRHEWTLSVPTDLEDINTTPADVRRFFFGEIPDSGTKIQSNY